MEKVSIICAKEYFSFESPNCVDSTAEYMTKQNLKIKNVFMLPLTQATYKIYIREEKCKSHPYIVQYFSVGDILCDSPIARKSIVECL